MYFALHNYNDRAVKKESQYSPCLSRIFKIYANFGVSIGRVPFLEARNGKGRCKLDCVEDIIASY